MYLDLGVYFFLGIVFVGWCTSIYDLTINLDDDGGRSASPALSV